jgi:hypothetical protein
MKTNQKLEMEDFLQQFPAYEMYENENLDFENWWEVNGDPNLQGAPVDIAAMFGGKPTQG